MDIQVSKLIEHLTKHHKPTDSIVVTWWSKDDVNLLLDEEVSDSRAEELWEEVAETFGQNLDDAIIAGNDYLSSLLEDATATNKQGA